MWLPQGGAENLQFTQYSIIMLLSMLYILYSISVTGLEIHVDVYIQH